VGYSLSESDSDDSESQADETVNEDDWLCSRCKATAGSDSPVTADDETELSDRPKKRAKSSKKPAVVVRTLRELCAEPDDSGRGRARRGLRLARGHQILGRNKIAEKSAGHENGAGDFIGMHCELAWKRRISAINQNGCCN
jgi:hypothetical protein